MGLWCSRQHDGLYCVRLIDGRSARVRSSSALLAYHGVQLSGKSGVLIRRKPKVRFLPRRFDRQNINGIVADKVMHRTLNPVDVGSMPTDPTEKQVSGFRNQVSVNALKPEV